VERNQPSRLARLKSRKWSKQATDKRLKSNFGLYYEEEMKGLGVLERNYHHSAVCGAFDAQCFTSSQHCVVLDDV
jgi:hypothetical protein